MSSVGPGRRHEREPIGTRWTAANTGGAIYAAALGAAVDLADGAWWGSSIPLTGGSWCYLAERTSPECIPVNGEGERLASLRPGHDLRPPGRRGQDSPTRGGRPPAMCGRRTRTASSPTGPDEGDRRQR